MLLLLGAFSPFISCWALPEFSFKHIYFFFSFIQHLFMEVEGKWSGREEKCNMKPIFTGLIIGWILVSRIAVPFKNSHWRNNNSLFSRVKPFLKETGGNGVVGEKTKLKNVNFYNFLYVYSCSSYHRHCYALKKKII